MPKLFIPQLLLLTSTVLLLAYSEAVNYDDFTEWPGVCQSGTEQSPININDNDSIECGKSKFNINFWDGNTVVNPGVGHGSNLMSPFPTSIITMVDPEGKLLQYNSAQYHLHAPSEHTFNGAHGDLQIHFVHKLNSMVFEAKRTYSVFGILFKEVPDNSNVVTIFDTIDFTAANQKINFNKTLSTLQDQAVFHYPGSFTTPNCDQLVNWFVFQKFLPIRTSQLAAIKAQINDGKSNNRPPLKLNARVVQLITPKCMTSFPIVGIVTVSFESRLGYLLLSALLALLLF